MYLKASGMGLQLDAYPAAGGPIVSGLLNDESLFLSGTSQCQHQWLSLPVSAAITRHVFGGARYAHYIQDRQGLIIA